MRVSGILAAKGATVATIAPEARISDAAAELRLRGVGALVVSADGRHIDGILSERDIVRRLAERGEHALGETVEDVMVTRVNTCAPEDSAEHLMRVMTEHRHRHLPVVSDDVLVGIVSIGDVVKSRLTELEEEARSMHDYITTGR